MGLPYSPLWQRNHLVPTAQLPPRLLTACRLSCPRCAVHGHLCTGRRRRKGCGLVETLWVFPCQPPPPPFR